MCANVDDLLLFLDRFAEGALIVGAVLTLLTAIALLLERAIFFSQSQRRSYLARRYGHLMEGVLEGDAEARRELAKVGGVDAILVLRLLYEPLFKKFDARRFANLRAFALPDEE